MNKKMKVFIVLLVFLQSTLYAENKQKNSLLVFVGEFVSLEKISSPKIINKSKNGKTDIIWSMNHKYEATFKVLKTIYGAYPRRLIKFDVYDHYGKPTFSKFKNSLMFISKRKDGSFYHEKYQFFDLYKTESKKWASCGSPYKFDTNLTQNINPKKIQFSEIVAYKIDSFVHTEEQLKEFFPREFFTIIGDYAVCNGLGTYANDLFKIKRNGVLKARGLF